VNLGTIVTTEFRSCDGSSGPIAVGVSQTVSVGMLIFADSIPPGDYEYKVTLSIVP
jgi:hypothetical protein